MDFIHDPYCPGETIAAVATPLGEGGVAIVRISGDQALDISSKIFSGKIKTYKTHTAHYGHIVDLEGKHVDDVLVLVMLGTRSYTGEDTVEIHCHGGSLITRRVLHTVLSAGAKPAKPGAFTHKAFINGKIDLAQAEAVQELIGAKNEHALDAAENQLRGRLSAYVTHFQKKFTDIAAILEAWVDFPDEGLEFASLEEITSDLEGLCKEMQDLEATYHNGKIVHNGLSLCLIGSPNVGKSSLMNALLDKDRAIVTPIAGTTRDTLEDHLRLNGLNFKLIDTAGIRENAELIEQEGIRRSKEAMQEADLILLVLDASKGIDAQDQELLNQIPKSKTLAIWNKIDLPHGILPPLEFPETVTLSAKEKIGLKSLHQAIDKVIWDKGPPSREEVLITNVRHKEALTQAIVFCQNVIDGLKNQVSPEFLSLDMRQTLQELGKLIGVNISESVLSAIFSKFCIGK